MARVRTRAHALARRGDRVAQLRATRPRRAARPRRPRRLLDADVHQLAAHGAVRPRVVAGLPRRRADRHRRPHAGVLVRARDRPRAAGDRRSERSTTRSRSTTTTRSGAPSTTTTGRRSTSSTRTASSATTTSAKDATRNRSASSSGCSASSASSSPSKGSASRRRPTGTTCVRPRRISATTRSEHFASPGGAAFDERRAYELPEHLRFNHWALAGEWTIGRENVVLDQAGGSIAYRFHARDAHLVLSPGAREPIPFRVLLDGEAPGPSHGVDVDEDGNGLLRDGRLYQLVRAARRGPRADAGDHVPRARRRGVRVHVRLGATVTG